MRIARQFLALILSRWTSLGLGFLTSVISARALGPERQGEFTLLVATSGLLAVLLGAGLPTAGAFLLKQARVPPGELVGSITGYFAAIAGGVGLLVGAGRPWIGLLAHRQLGLEVEPLWLWLIAALLLTTLCSAFLTPILIVGDRIRLASSWGVAAHAVGLAATWLFVVSLRLGITGALIASLCSQALSLVVLAWWLSQLGPGGRLRFRIRTITAALRIGIQQFLVSSFAALFKKGDSYILAALLDVRSVGYYSVAMSLYDLVIDIPRTLVWLMVRETTDRPPGERELLAARSIRLQILASTALVLAGAIALPALLPVVYGEEFIAASAPLLILLAGVPFRTVHLGVSAYFIGVGYPGAMLLPVGAAAASNLGLDFAAIPTLGMLGAALTMVLGEVVLAALSARAFLGRSSLGGPRTLLPTWSDMRMMVSLSFRLLKADPRAVPPFQIGNGE